MTTSRPTPYQPELKSALLWPRDVVRVAGHGLRTRPLRAVLSALGIAIGIGALVAVIGISTSSQARLNALLDELGTNMLTVAPGQTLGGQDAQLPEESVPMITRIAPVESATATGMVSGARVYRTDLIPVGQSRGIAVLATQLDVLDTVSGTIASGAWLNEATATQPAVVLGARTANRLGLHRAGPDIQIWLGGQWFSVVGILDPVPLASELDTAALIGWPVAEDLLGFDGYPTTAYVRANDAAIPDVIRVLPATANPERPEEVQVSRPSDALQARAAVDETLTALLLGLGGVALLVGGVGVANTMVISVLERRNEIGLRRALGATKGQIRTQFLAEALLLSALGGAAGVLLGTGVTAGYATTQGWLIVVPAWVMVGGIGATLVIGAIAGLYPAVRAARMDPIEALSTT